MIPVYKMSDLNVGMVNELIAKGVIFDVVSLSNESTGIHDTDAFFNRRDAAEAVLRPSNTRPQDNTF